MEPEWRIIETFPSYEVSTSGQVRSLRYAQNTHLGKILKQSKSGGYLFVALNQHGKKYRKTVHRLMALAFLGQPPTPRHQVAHNNGCRSHNTIDNLRWATPEENQNDRLQHGTDIRGQKHGSAKLANADIPDIRKMRRSGRPVYEIAARYAVCESTISMICLGYSWKHMP